MFENAIRITYECADDLMPSVHIQCVLNSFTGTRDTTVSSGYMGCTTLICDRSHVCCIWKLFFFFFELFDSIISCSTLGTASPSTRATPRANKWDDAVKEEGGRWGDELYLRVLSYSDPTSLFFLPNPTRGVCAWVPNRRATHVSC